MKGDGKEALTPAQRAALHWAKRDLKAVGAEAQQGAGEKQDGGEANAVENDTERIAGKLRNGKKHDIGRRLGGI